MRSKPGAVLAVLLALATPDPKGGSHADLQGRIEASEYAIDAEGGTYRATNEAHRFRSRFGLRGIVLAPEGDPQDPWTWGLEWIGYGGGPDRWGVPEPALSAEGNRADLHRGSLLEWYENEPRGLKQGFLLPALLRRHE